jgi:(4-alkanoyl-5-oxo-2,5-dihydrofuran-3-yl)methyl phosphate reductase
MTYLITGATGNVGGRVAEQLIARGHRPRLLVRDAARARARFGSLVDLISADLSNAQTLRGAFDAVERAFVVNVGSDLALRDAAFAHAARAAGVRHLVKLSSFGARRDSTGLGAWHAAGEAAIREAGVDWTFVRPGPFMTNCLGWIASIRSQSAVFSGTGDGKLASIDTDDVAAVVVAALTQPGHEGRIYELTGNEALTHAQMLALIGQATGRTLALMPISDEAARENLRRTGMPPAMVEALGDFQPTIRAGGMATMTGDVERVLGRTPATFANWIDKHAELFR